MRTTRENLDPQEREENAIRMENRMDATASMIVAAIARLSLSCGGNSAIEAVRRALEACVATGIVDEKQISDLRAAVNSL